MRISNNMERTCERCRKVVAFSHMIRKFETGPVFNRTRWLCEQCYTFICRKIDFLLNGESVTEEERKEV